ncbi:MAG TPA: ankyrin repeat domain-containing protein [Parachlamydiaceae bacterium]|nr:ankyrin repeat domain-containing protein [Parachlamydiaceae bacterium]
MLTPYNATCKNENIFLMDVDNAPEEKNNRRPALKRQTMHGLYENSIFAKKIKSEPNLKLDKETRFNYLKQYVEKIYPACLMYFNTNSDPIDLSTAYHFAADNIDLELIQLLILYDVPVNILDGHNESSLMVACRVHNSLYKAGGFLEARSGNIIKLLLDSKCDPLQQNQYGTSPIHLMALSKSVDLFKKLKALNYDLNTSNSYGDSPLIYLCKNLEAGNEKKSIEIISTLVLLGCDLMQKNMFGETPLEILVTYKILDADGYLALLDQDVIPEGKLTEAYEILLRTDDIKVFERLISEGIDVDTFDCKGKTPLYRAIESANQAAIAFLLKMGADALLNRPIDCVKHGETSNPFGLLVIQTENCKVKIDEFIKVIPELRTQIRNLKTQMESQSQDYNSKYSATQNSALKTFNSEIKHIEDSIKAYNRRNAYQKSQLGKCYAIWDLFPKNVIQLADKLNLEIVSSDEDTLEISIDEELIENSSGDLMDNISHYSSEEDVDRYFA